MGFVIKYSELLINKQVEWEGEDIMRTRLKQVLIAFFFIGILAAVANASENKWTIYKDQWIGDVLTDFPKKFCDADQYFCQCYDVNQEKCEAVVVSACKACIDKYKDKIPNVLNQPDDGRHWGQVISECVGSSYNAALKDKKKKNDKCDNVKSWQ